MVITIDGPAGAGKSTLARKLAQALKLSYLDTGAMYRALTLKALRAKIDLKDEEQLADLARGTEISFSEAKDGLRIHLDGEDVTDLIRSPQVTNSTFYIAKAPRIREIMVEWQRMIGRRASIVAEGRDLGTVVFPGADKKFYLDADFEERTRRRFKELRDKGQVVDAKALASELNDRDHKDYTRSVGPLKKAVDAIVIDSTSLSIDEVLEEMLRHIPSSF